MGMYDNLTPEQLEKLYQEANEDLAWREKEWR